MFIITELFTPESVVRRVMFIITELFTPASVVRRLRLGGQILRLSLEEDIIKNIY